VSAGPPRDHVEATEVRVRFLPDAREVLVRGEQTFVEAAHAAGIDITATCGRRGRCTSCRIKILRGAVPPPTLMDTVQLSEEELREGYRLSCQTQVIEPAEVLVAPPHAEASFQILTSAADLGQDQRLALDSGVRKTLVSASPPQDENHQTSDVEEVLRGVQGASDGLSLDLVRGLPSLLRDAGGRLTVATFGGQVLALERGDTRAQAYGFAFDIGTTSVVGHLVDLASGEVLYTASALNPQAVYGGDLMSRIAFAMNNPEALRKLTRKILGLLNGQIEEACDRAGVRREQVYKVTLVGNTCMHHISLGIDPTYVGLAPYAPVLRSGYVCRARDLALKVHPNAVVCYLPIVAGFVGADTMGVVLATRIYESREVRAAVDIGTNGEVVMGNRDKLMACSAPAGPALEGAQIKHGMRGAVGAIDKVSLAGDVRCHVIGDAPAIGICGSGLIDAVAGMLDAGILDPSGLLRVEDRERLPPALGERLIVQGEERQFVLLRADETGGAEDLVITQADIRQVQLAKGAIASGIRMLGHVMGVGDPDLAELMLAGGFGNYLSLRSAVRIGLIPPLPRDRIRYVGNAAALGAQMCLVSEAERARAEALARRIEHVSLAAHPDFQDIFVEAVTFPAGDPWVGPASG
jgi:uncharacterized 2Fe-2S/4Fe-4S cluster protein (DUF4445 family)